MGNTRGAWQQMLAGRLRNDPSQVMVCCTLKTTITADKQHPSCSLSVGSLSCSSSHNKCLKLVQMFFCLEPSQVQLGAPKRAGIAAERMQRPGRHLRRCSCYNVSGALSFAKQTGICLQILTKHTGAGFCFCMFACGVARTRWWGWQILWFSCDQQP